MSDLPAIGAGTGRRVDGAGRSTGRRAVKMVVWEAGETEPAGTAFIGRKVMQDEGFTSFSTEAFSC